MRQFARANGWWLTGVLAAGSLIFAVLAFLADSQAEILIEWSTASELDTIGYNLYRADSAQAPFTKINSSLIPASPDPQAGGDYSFRDPNVVVGKVYFYQLESISQTGETEQHGPILAEARSGFPAAWPLTIVCGASTLLSAVYTIISKRAES